MRILAIYFELLLFISSELIINSTLSLFVDDQAFDGSSVGMKNTIASLSAFFFSCSFKLVLITLVQYSFSFNPVFSHVVRWG